MIGLALGLFFPRAPELIPGRAPLPTSDPVAAAIAARDQGELRRAAALYTEALASKKLGARSRAALELALGRTWLDLDEPGLALPALARARAPDVPVAPWASWYEARAQLARGQYAAAAATCTAARARWPEGPFASECLVLIGEAHGAAGNRAASHAAYNAWLDQAKKGLPADAELPREEPIRLGMALATLRSDPKAAIVPLQTLALDHAYHPTGMTAEAALANLAARGFDTRIPDTLENRKRRAAERRRCGFAAEGLELLQALDRDSVDNREIQGWIRAQEQRFLLDARQNDAVAAALATELARAPDASMAWDRWTALSRGGDWRNAVAQYEDGMRRFPGRFNNKEIYARALVVAGKWPEARAAWEARTRLGGKDGAEARWMVAFATFREGKLDDALARFTTIATSTADEAEAAAWYRSRTLESRGRGEEARAARQALVKRDPRGWYGVLAANALASGNDWASATNQARSGRWHVPDLPSLPSFPRTGPARVGAGAIAWGEAHQATPVHWSALAWGPRTDFDAGAASLTHVSNAADMMLGEALRSTPPRLAPSGASSGERGEDASAEGGAASGAASTGPRPRRSASNADREGGAPPPPQESRSSTNAARVAPPVLTLPLARPAPVRPSFLYDPVVAARTLGTLADKHATDLPALRAVADLAGAGLYDLSGSLLGRTLDQLEKDKKDLEWTVAERRQVNLYARDLHHAVKSCWNATKLAANDAQRDDAMRCQFPAAESDALWRHGEAYDLDPLLALGIMRQESVYRPWALSQVGAIGLVQVMPRTGGRVAALLGEPHYSPEQLENPATNLRYGSFYLARLLDRFGGDFPLAVASYNGGPHNVSSWLRPWKRANGTTWDLRMDDYVEQIPYTETRDYVKKVTGWYATYVALYAPAGSHVRIPATISLDDPKVIDF